MTIRPYEKNLLTPLGLAKADLIYVGSNVEEYSEYHCWQNETGEPWWWPQPLVRHCKAISELRSNARTDIHLTDDLIIAMLHHILRHKSSPFYARALTLSSKEE